MRHSVMLRIFIILVLAGCSSFNNSFNTYTGLVPAHNQVMSDAEITSVPSVSDDAPKVIALEPPMPVQVMDKKCTRSPFFTITKTPPLPFDDIKKAGNDVALIEKIERQHIDTLRAFISKARRTQDQVQLDYLNKCKAVAK